MVNSEVFAAYFENIFNNLPETDENNNNYFAFEKNYTPISDEQYSMIVYCLLELKIIFITEF